MTDRIVLAGLRLRGNHGLHEFERRQGQHFVVDVVLEVDTRKAAKSDSVCDTVDYGDLADRVAGIVSGAPVNLIETLAEKLATMCLTDSRVNAVEVTVHKPQAPIEHEFSDIAVRIRRERTQTSHPKFRRLGTANLVPVPDDDDKGDGAAVA